MTNNNTALQVTNFNFYGDELIALKDNATGEIYTSINSILRGIGFTQRQIKHIHKKWCEDVIVSKGVQICTTHEKWKSRDNMYIKQKIAYCTYKNIYNTKNETKTTRISIKT